ncbi:SDR family oxidoreductase [Aquibium microcysteis]|uniref:SDR family oxidoreductase n=1 Tax=Aquibium microcysteis TaxID=675281 RepID=UPI00165D0A5F|nr:SDR family oxidoreductase [Aquibium microcysteis]
MLLKDHVVVVTGAGGALGSALVAAVAAQGGIVLGTDLVAGAGVDIVHDVTSEASWRAVCEEVEKRHGRIDGLVNNAGIVHVGHVETTEIDDFRRVQAVNVEGVFLGCKVAWPLLRRSTAASIVNVSSTAGLVGSPNHVAYVASKGAVRLMSKSIALHGATFDPVIRCNSLHPSLMDGHMARVLTGNAENQSEAIQAIVAARNPMRRLALTSEVAGAAVFLLSRMSGFVTGSELVSDGGSSAQ